jgi:chromosome segregation ATPase
LHIKGGVALAAKRSRKSGGRSPKRKRAPKAKVKARQRKPKPRRREGPADLNQLKKKLESQDKKIKELYTQLKELEAKKSLMLKALGLPEKPRKGKEGTIKELQESLIKMEEYLLSTSGRIDNILNALKTHRQFLLRINRKVFRADAKRKIKMELDIMMNTLSILAMNGVDFDHAISRDIKKLSETINDDKVELSELKKRKERLDDRFRVELKRYDLESLYTKRKTLPGYG